ncbi:hypothetical protein [Variovorax gossypii]
MASRRARIQIIASQAGVAPRARAIWVRHPVLKQLTATAVTHFDAVPLGVGSEDLVHCAVRNAVRAFDMAKESAPGSVAPPSAHYIAELLLALSRALLVRVEIGGETWDPSTQSWSRFSSAHGADGPADVAVVARSKKASRKAMEEAFRAVCAQFSIEAEEVIPLVQFDCFAGAGSGGDDRAHH